MEMIHVLPFTPFSTTGSYAVLFSAAFSFWGETYGVLFLYCRNVLYNSNYHNKQLDVIYLP
jgi:hypothetical protein